MSYLVSFPLGDGSSDVLVVEADRSEATEGLVLASSSPGELADRAKVTFEDALRQLRPSLQRVGDLLKSLSPDEATVEFGLSVGGETGLIVAKGTAGVNFAIRMTWGPKKKDGELDAP